MQMIQLESWRPVYIAGAVTGTNLDARPWMVVQPAPRLRHLVERKRKNMRHFTTYKWALRAANAQNRLDGLPEIPITA